MNSSLSNSANLKSFSSSLLSPNSYNHLLQALTNPKRRLRLTPNLINRHPLGMLDQCQALHTIALKHRQISNNRADALLACERECTLLEDLGVALLVDVFHGDDDFGLCGVGDEVHGAADAFDFAGEHEVC